MRHVQKLTALALLTLVSGTACTTGPGPGPSPAAAAPESAARAPLAPSPKVRVTSIPYSERQRIGAASPYFARMLRRHPKKVTVTALPSAFLRGGKIYTLICTAGSHAMRERLVLPEKGRAFPLNGSGTFERMTRDPGFDLTTDQARADYLSLICDDWAAGKRKFVRFIRGIDDLKPPPAGVPHDAELLRQIKTRRREIAPRDVEVSPGSWRATRYAIGERTGDLFELHVRLESNGSWQTMDSVIEPRMPVSLIFYTCTCDWCTR